MKTFIARRKRIISFRKVQKICMPKLKNVQMKQTAFGVNYSNKKLHRTSRMKYILGNRSDSVTGEV
jgi:hypothetical protein